MMRKINFESFKEYNFALYDQILFSDYKYFFEEKEIKYKFLGVDLFGSERNSPILISLNDIPDTDKEEIYEFFFIEKETNYHHSFDRMNVFQILIKSAVNVDILADELTMMMVVKSKYLFRYYDPRVVLHLILIKEKGLYIQNKFLRNWSENYFKNIDGMVLSLWGKKIIYDSKHKDYNSKNYKSNIDFDDIDLLNKKIKMNSNKYYEYLIGSEFSINYKVYED